MTLRLDELLRAAADLTRLRILNLLRHGSVCVCDLQRVLELAQPKVSRHLAVLRHAGLVSDIRNGNRVMYSLAPADGPQRKAFFEFLQHCAGYEEVMQKDAHLLESVLREGECATAEVTNERERIAS